MSHTLHESRFNRAAKYVAEMDLLNVECKLADAKKAHLLITNENQCAICGKSIADKVFIYFLIIFNI
jgi:hypothetical protein